jgi:hypothetical protein
MARDLIPPPSPAGRPDLEGTQTHRFVELPPEPVAAPPEPPRVERKLALPPTQYRNRFGFLAGALGGVVLWSIALLAAVLLWNGNGGEDAGMHANWSAWQPADESLEEGATQIAEHIGPKYTYPDGNQLLQIKPIAGEIPITLDSTRIVDLKGDNVIYQLKGMGDGGTIKGEASNERGAVVFREALELSLYTFRYLPDAEGVLVMIPPPPTDPKTEAANLETLQKASSGDPAAVQKAAEIQQAESLKQRAIYFRPGDLKSELQVPLGVTVPAGTPNAETITQAEADEIMQRVRSNLFKWRQDPQTGELILSPMN